MIEYGRTKQNLRCVMERIAGIVAEYNPLHRGHQYHMEETRRVTGADALLVVMSGDYVQRGTPAVLDQYERTRMALLAGADLVVELPVSCACASAEAFALGSVQILNGLGIVTDLCFGSEDGTLAPFVQLAPVLAEEPASFRETLTSLIKEGYSFPAARQKALLSCLTVLPDSARSGFPKNWQEFLGQPNNILGLEYCKALRRTGSSIRPCTIARAGGGYHDEQLMDSSRGFCSASALRRAIFDGGPDLLLSGQIPAECADTLTAALKQGNALTADDFSPLLHMRLLQEDASSLTGYLDVSEGLANRIQNRKAQYRSFSQFARLLKTRELTLTRIQRALLHILLGIRKTTPPSYIRILGVRKDSRWMLSRIRSHSLLPVIATPAEGLRCLSGDALADLRFQSYVCDLYESVRCKKNQSAFREECKRPLLVL